MSTSPSRAVASGFCLALFLFFVGPAAGEPTETDPDAAMRDPDYAAGKLAVERKDWTEAIRRFRKAAVRAPENADLHNYLGYSYRNLRQYQQAFAHYELALKLDPRHRGAHEYIGEAYLQTGNLAGAERHLARLREICLLPCEELTDLEKAVADHKTRAAAPKR